MRITNFDFKYTGKSTKGFLSNALYTICYIKGNSSVQLKKTLNL